MDINVSSESTIENIFSNFLILNGETYQFSIPLYQREYSTGCCDHNGQSTGMHGDFSLS